MALLAFVVPITATRGAWWHICALRMHRTLKQETARPPGMNVLQQQDCFDRFVHEFNEERPHEALGMQTPGGCLRTVFEAL